MLWVGDFQPAPYLGRIRVEGQYVLPELLQDNRQPRLEQLGLIDVTAMAKTT